MRTRSLSACLAAVALLGAGCNVVTLDQWPCPTGGTTLTYDNFGLAFFADYCNRCHSAPDGARNGAPDDEVFGDVTSIRAHAAIIFENAAATNDAMPPGPDDIPGDARDHLADWLACGAP
jgi:hypothetical protein